MKNCIEGHSSTNGMSQAQYSAIFPNSPYADKGMCDEKAADPDPIYDMVMDMAYNKRALG